MKKAYSIISLLSVVIILTTVSCKKVINLNLRNGSGLLVIEGNITNDSAIQYVRLSRNVPFTNTNQFPPVSGATVTITDNTTTYTLTEGPAGTYSAANFRGIPLHTYSLSVKADGQTYTATSTMPEPVDLMAVKTKADEINPKSNKREITAFYIDPANVTNQYRFVLSVNGIEINRAFAFNDDFTNGRYVANDLRQNQVDIVPGNNVIVEMQCIDKPVYTYWFSLMQQQGFNAGSTTPSNPPTNISPNVLGYFSAHTSQRTSLKVQ